MLLAFERRFSFGFMLNSHFNERLHKYDGCDVDMNIWQISENLFKNKY